MFNWNSKPLLYIHILPGEVKWLIYIKKRTITIISAKVNLEFCKYPRRDISQSNFLLEWRRNWNPRSRDKCSAIIIFEDWNSLRLCKPSSPWHHSCFIVGRLFVLPLFDGVLMEQSLLLNRRRNDEPRTRVKHLAVSSHYNWSVITFNAAMPCHLRAWC